MGTSGALAMKISHRQAAHCRIAQWTYCGVGLRDGGRPGRMPAPSMLRCGSDACLPSGVGQLFGDMVADGLITYCCGPRAVPGPGVSVRPVTPLCRSYRHSALRSNHHCLGPRTLARSHRRVRSHGGGPMKDHHSRRCGYYSTSCLPTSRCPDQRLPDGRANSCLEAKTEVVAWTLSKR